MRRRVFVGRAAAAVTAAAAALVVAGAPAVHAEDWCDVDPAVRVITPKGSRQTVHLTVSALGDAHRMALKRAAVDWTAVPEGTGTRVTITVVVPLERGLNGVPAPFPTRALVTTRAFAQGTVLARSAEGPAGTPLTLSYYLDVA